MPKILHIITRVDWGGSAVNTMMCASLPGHETKIVTGSFSPGEPPAGVILLPEMGREISPLRDLRAFFRLMAIIRAEKPDIVHTHASKAGMLGRWAAFACHWRGVDAQIMHTPHGHVFYGYFSKPKELLFILLERLTAHITDIFVALTAGERNESEKYLPASRGRWMVIHSGVDLEGEYAALSDPQKRAEARSCVRAELGIPDTACVVGTVARLEHVKGVEYFVHMAAALRRDKGGLCFLIVGDGGEGPKLRALAQGLGLTNVIFAGYRKDVPRAMAAMDIYVQPSLNEGMGRTLVEAQALELPVAASAVCGIPDVVLNGETGLLVPPADAPALAEAVLKIRAASLLSCDMGRKGREWVLSPDENGLPRFSGRAMLKKLEQAYAVCLARK